MKDAKKIDPHPRVAIIGAGFSGMCLAIKLKEAGIHSFTLYEKAEGLGGTWRDNTYPGAQCDSPIYSYCYSFEPKTDWSHKWVPQDEILAYAEHCADKYGLRPHMRFGTEIESASFDGRECVWEIRTTAGEVMHAEVLVSAVGQLNRPLVPKIPGLDSFRGPWFHSARWNHAEHLEGKSVAVIGTAASAIQLIPAIAPKVGRLKVFQRSPNWIIPRFNRAYGPKEQRFWTRHPLLARLYRWWLWVQGEIFMLQAIKRNPLMSGRMTKIATEHMQAQIWDPKLREALRPDYPIGGKRILISDDFYPALARDNVDLITKPIDHIAEDGIVTRDGQRHAADVLIFATGFETTDFLAPMKIASPEGVLLSERWKRGARGYLGIAVSGFPNLFMMYGPNTNLGHNSIIFMIECQARYIVDCVALIARRQLGSIEVKEDVMRRYNAGIQDMLKDTAWAATGKSWYKTADGQITNNWPNSTVRYWWKTLSVDPQAYHLVSKAASHERPPLERPRRESNELPATVVVPD